MIKIKEFFHELLLIKEGEAAPLFHFWFIFMLTIGIGLAIGRASSDSLFLSRYGVEYLPVIYIVFAPLLAFVSIFYAALVDNFPPEKFFNIILVGLILSVFLSWLMMSQTDSELIYPFYFIIHKISSELLVVHGSLYLVHNFNTLQAKRLFPLIFTGEQLGCIIGGGLVSASTSIIETVHLPLLWILLMFLGLFQLYFWHNRMGVSPYYQNIKQSGSKLKVAVQSVSQGLTFARESSLLKYASYALFFLVIIYYILSYSTSRIFVNAYQDEQDLTKFLGLLTAATSFITLSIQLFLTNRIINRYGVRKLNLIFPLITASAAGALLASFTLTIGVIVSIARDSLLNSLQNPLRVIFFNALPGYMQGRAGAVSIAFVMPLALLLCGLLLWGIQKLDHIAYFLIPCLIVALAFLYYSHKMNQTYTNSLTTHLKDRLYFPVSDSSDIKLELGDNALELLKTSFTEIPQTRNITVSLLAKHYPEKSVDFIIPKLSDMSAADIDVYLKSLFSDKNHLLPYKTLSRFPLKDSHIQSTLLKLIADNNYQEATTLALDNKNSKSSRMRSTVAYTLLKNNKDSQFAIKLWEELLQGDKYDKLSSISLVSLLDYVSPDKLTTLTQQVTNAVDDLLKDDDIEIKGRTIQQLPNYLKSLDQHIIINCMDELCSHPKPEYRIYASYGLRLLNDEDRYKYIYRLLSDSHAQVKSKTLVTLDLEDKDSETIIKKWLLKGLSSPRVQSIILEKAIEKELITHKELKDFSLSRALTANDFSTAKKIISSKTEITPNEKIFLLVLEERRINYIDLSLQALSPLCAEDQISVIRAGLVSKHSQIIANASEILINIENQPATKIIEQQLSNESHTNSKSLPKSKLDANEDVISWAINSNDEWLSYIANIVQGTDMNKTNSNNIIERISLLKNTDVFSEVPTDDLLFVAKELEEIRYFGGDHIFDINEYGDRMYIISEGKVGISISSDSSSKDYIVTLESGSSFGEMNLLDSLPRSASAHALEDSYLLTLEKNKLLGLLSSYPELALGILRALSSIVRESHQRNKELLKNTNN